MMNLFRKYQKIFLGIITIFIITSFVFFGTYDAILGNRALSVQDYVIGKALDGSEIRHREIQNLAVVLDTDAQDVMIIEERARINLLNDGVVRYDIFSSNIGKELYSAYSDFFKEELAAKMERYRTYKPYMHASQAMGMESLWKQFVPRLAEDFERFKGVSATLSPESFDALVNLYVDQVHFPPRMARQFLHYNQQQYKMPQDPYLVNGDLSLFYAKTVSDWFGPRFIEMVSEFIHNAAIYAVSKGYSVSDAETKASLMQIGMENLQKLERGRTISGEEFAKFFQNQITALGMTEKEVVAAWKKVLLFRRLVTDVENGLMVDAPFYKEMQKDAAKGVHVELYRLPREYRGLSEEDLFKLETYLTKKVNGAPELNVKKFKVKLAHLEKKNLPSEVSLKRTWAWEIEDNNWKLLADSFPEVAKCKEKDSEARFSYLNGLTDKKRSEIDHFARMRIIDETPEFIHEKLESSDADTMVLKIFESEEVLPGVKDKAKFVGFLEKEAKFIYNEDREHYYRVEVLERQGTEVMTFSDAKAALEKAKTSVMPRLIAMLEKGENVDKEELKLTGRDPHALLGMAVFDKEEGYVSQVEMSEEGPYYYRVGKHFVDEEAISNAMKEARQKLGREASDKLMKQLMGEIKIYGSETVSSH